MMTIFEQLAMDLIGTVETGADGMYTGRTRALAEMVNAVILNDDEKIRHATWVEQRAMITEMFYKTFPYCEAKQFNKYLMKKYSINNKSEGKHND